MLTVILQSTVEFVALRRGERHGFKDGGDAIPDVLHELDPLGNTELERVCDGYFAQESGNSRRAQRVDGKHAKHHVALPRGSLHRMVTPLHRSYSSGFWSLFGEA